MRDLSRCRDYSKGAEKTPVAVTNEIDDALPPGLDPVADKDRLIDTATRRYKKDGCAFEYVTEMRYDAGVPRPAAVELTPAQRNDPHG